MAERCDIDCPLKTDSGNCGLTSCVNPQAWRDATAEELRAVRNYVDSISADTGINLYDYLD